MQTKMLFTCLFLMKLLLHSLFWNSIKQKVCLMYLENTIFSLKVAQKYVSEMRQRCFASIFFSLSISHLWRPFCAFVSVRNKLLNTCVQLGSVFYQFLLYALYKYTLYRSLRGVQCCHVSNSSFSQFRKYDHIAVYLIQLSNKPYGTRPIFFF